MDGELIAVGVGLAALTTGLFAWLRADISGLGKRLDRRIDDLGERMEKRIDELDERLGKRIDDLDGRLRAVEHGQAKLEGLLEGLREAISGRNAA